MVLPTHDLSSARRVPIRVIVADDHRIVRTAERMLLQTVADIRVIGEAADGRDALALIERLIPDVAVLELELRCMDGVAVTQAIAARGIPTRVVILTLHVDERNHVLARAAGAVGYLAKDTADRELVSAIRAVMSRRDHPSPPLARMPDIRQARGLSPRRPHPRRWPDELR